MVVIKIALLMNVMMNALIAVKLAVMTALAGKFVVIMIPIRVQNGLLLNYVQAAPPAGMESVTAMKDPTGIAQMEGVLIVANTIQAVEVMMNVLIAVKPAVMTALAGKFAEIMIPIRVQNGLHRENVQVLLRAGMEGVIAMKDLTAIVREETVLIVVNTIQAAQKVLMSVLKDRAVTAIIISRQPLPVILKSKPNIVVPGVQVAGQMWEREQELNLNIVQVAVLSVLANGVAG